MSGISSRMMVGNLATQGKSSCVFPRAKKRIQDDILKVFHVIWTLSMTLGHQVDGFLILSVQHVRFTK